MPYIPRRTNWICFGAYHLKIHVWIVVVLGCKIVGHVQSSGLSQRESRVGHGVTRYYGRSQWQHVVFHGSCYLVLVTLGTFFCVDLGSSLAHVDRVFGVELFLMPNRQGSPSSCLFGAFFPRIFHFSTVRQLAHLTGEAVATKYFKHIWYMYTTINSTVCVITIHKQ